VSAFCALNMSSALFLFMALVLFFFSTSISLSLSFFSGSCIVTYLTAKRVYDSMDPGAGSSSDLSGANRRLTSL